jgi:hypothetical protein
MQCYWFDLKFGALNQRNIISEFLVYGGLLYHTRTTSKAALTSVNISGASVRRQECQT